MPPAPTMNRKSDPTGILRRGSACLSCRRRKLRCDGHRPICAPCSTMKRAQECKYDDSMRKSRTQTLREKKAALEAKVIELEQGKSLGMGMPSTSATWPRIHNDDYVDPQLPSAPEYPVDLSIWNAQDYDNGLAMQAGTQFTFQFENTLNFTLSTSPVPFHHPIMSNPGEDNLSASLTPLHPQSVSDSSVGSIQDNVFNDSSPSPVTSREMHDVLIESFILHRKQCCFYSDTSRFDPSSSPSAHQNPPPNMALMSAIYLLGSFFAQVPGWESKLLEQTLQEVSLSLHNAEPPADMVQALCLLAQYFFFTARDMEGNRHLSAARRIAIDIGLHQVSPTTTFPFNPEYALDGPQNQNWSERAAIFWQLYMVNNLWSSNDDCCVVSSAFAGAPCRHVTTPLPVEDGASYDVVISNSPVHGLYEANNFRAENLSITAFKVMASSLFDRTLRVHNTVVNDEATWTYRHHAETALVRLSDLVQPHTLRDAMFTTEKPPIDGDLYVVQSLLLASTIHLHIDNIMDLKISRSARSVVELIHQLTDDDYQLLDPILTVCWSSIAKIFHDMLEAAKQKISANGPSSSLNFAVKYLDHCIQVLLSALQNMARTIPLADILLSNLEKSQSPLYPALERTFYSHQNPDFSLNLPS